MQLVLLHGAHQELAIRAEGQGHVAAGPLQHRGLLLGDAGVPEPGAVIGGRGDPPTLGVERHVGHRLLVDEDPGKGRVSRVADVQFLAGGEGDQLGLSRRRHRLDPAPGNLRDLRDLGAPRPDHRSVVAPGENPFAAGMQAGRQRHPLVGGGGFPALESDRAIAEREDGLAVAVEEGGGDIGVVGHAHARLLAA